MTYQAFAHMYDVMMSEELYDKWAEYVKESLSNPCALLELGCGSGRLGIKLAQAGFKMTGLDMSEEMLTLAKYHQIEHNTHFPLVQGDMQVLSSVGVYDAIISFNDSLCYLPTPEALEQVFRGCYDALTTGGLLLFDVHSTAKMALFDGFSYHAEIDDCVLIWDSYAGVHEHSCEHDVSVLIKQSSGMYTRYDERHYERTYTIKTYRQLLEASGFKDISVTGDFEQALSPQAKRWFFKATKKESYEISRDHS